MSPPVRLFGYFRSSCSWRVRIALNWKGIAYDTVPVHLLREGGEQHQDAYRMLNPMREVPTLEIDGVHLAQSLAILEYLEETRPEPPLLPREPHLRARARQLAEIVNAGIQPVQNLRVLQQLGRSFDADDAARRQWAAHWISQGLEAFERIARETAGTCSVGDSVTFADLCLVPQLYNARRFGVDPARFETISRIEGHLVALPAFRNALPERQPDAPADTPA